MPKVRDCESNVPKVHTKFDPPRHDGLDCGTECKTDQSFAEEADINNIMRRYMKTGILGDPLQPQMAARFEDVTGAPEDFLEAQQKLLAADESFMRLPSKLRRRFNDSPVELMRFLSDAGNRAEAINLGLIAPEKAQKTPEKVSVGTLGDKGTNVPETP